MLLFCWNVAGLSTTCNRIHDAYNPVNPNKKKALPSVALQEYLRRHNADICCLQEHKIPLAQLSSRLEPRGCSTVEGYESFWSCCVDKNKRGLNGVVTYAKTGTVQSADGAPLGSEDLDGQGRCVMTDHGSFVLFNVYVPASGGQPLAYKMKFLQALRAAMQRQRRTKPVMLVGDLNISHKRLDVYWKDRVVHIADILQEVAAAATKEEANLPSWKRQVAKAWPQVVAALETKQVVETQTTNSLTKEKFDKFRLAVTVGDRRVYLGKHESSEDYCLYNYQLEGCTYENPETGEQVRASEDQVVSVGVLAELMVKIAGVEWDHATQRMIALSEDAGVRRLSPPRQWLDAVLTEDDMVDTFRHFHPSAEARYTCWHQFTNRRYSNEGARIDYCLVDRVLLQHVQQGSDLRCNCKAGEDPLKEPAAFCAATANGLFKPVSFQGEGIEIASQTALDTQFGAPHTGIVYTPPSFSDHVGVSLLLDDTCCPTDLTLDEKDACTRKAQPHKAQKSIASFFSAKSQTSMTTTSTQMKRKEFPKAQVGKKTVKSFFAPRGQGNESTNNDTKRPRIQLNGKKKATLLKKNEQKPAKGLLRHFRKS